MPRLPTPQSNPQLPRQFATAETQGAAVGRGLADLGQGIANVGGALQELERRRQQKKEQDEISSLNRELATAKADLTIAVRDEFANADPNDDTVEERVNNLVRDRLTGLASLATTDGAKRFFAEQEASAMANFRVRIDEQGMNLTASRRAADFTKSTDTLTSLVVSTPDAFPDAVEQLRSTFSLLTPQEAQASVAEYGRLAEGYVQGLILSEKNPQRALDELLAGDLDEYIDGERKAKLIRAAQSQLKAEKDYSRALAQLEFDDDIGQIAQTGDPGRWTKEALSAIADNPVEERRLHRALDQAVAVGNAAAGYQDMSLPEIAQDVGSAAAGLATAPEYKTARAQAEAKRDALKMIADAYKADPAAAAIQRNPAVAGAAQDAFSTGDPQAFGRYATLVAEQQRRDLPGVSPRILTDQMAESLRQAFTPTGEGGDTDRIVRSLAETQNMTGRYWSTVSRDLYDKKILSPGQYVAAHVAGEGRPALAREIVEADILGEEQLRALGDAKGLRTSAREHARAAFADFRETLPLRDLAVADAFEEATASLILARRARGDNTNPARAAKEIARDMLLEQYRFRGSFRVPVGVDADRVRTTSNNIRRDLTNAQLAGPPGLGDYAARVRAGGYWVTNGDETGLRLVDENGTIVKERMPDGTIRPFVRQWADLLEDDAELTSRIGQSGSIR